MKKNDYNDVVKKSLTVVSSTKMGQRIGNHISRRSFTKSVSRIIGLGTLSHFSLLTNNLQAETITNSDDECPGGGDDPDECVSGTPEDDECPGGQPEVDNCPTGEAPEDECTAAGGCSGGDQETSIAVVDLCLIPAIDGCFLISRDNAE